MNEKTDKSKIREEARALRMKSKRLETSRDAIKAKSREKGKSIKANRDRQAELEKNRDDWKAKCKEQEKAYKEADEKYKYIADLLNMKEEQLMQTLEEFEELKKKYPPKNHR